jgi:hypothetical protein
MPSGYSNMTSGIGYSAINGFPGLDNILLAGAIIFLLTVAILVTGELERYKRLKSLIEFISNFAGNVVIGGIVFGCSWLVYQTLKAGASNIHLTLEEGLMIVAGIIVAGLVGDITRKIIDRISANEAALQKEEEALRAGIKLP